VFGGDPCEVLRPLESDRPIWIQMVPGLTPMTTPVGPASTSAVAFRSVSMVRMMSAVAAACAGDGAAVAPASASAVTPPGSRFQTTTGTPAASRLRAMGVPILPRPSTAMVGKVGLRSVVSVISSPSSSGGHVSGAGSREGHGARHDVIDVIQFVRAETQRSGADGFFDVAGAPRDRHAAPDTGHTGGVSLAVRGIA
jgi:hypothetical protein